MIKKISKITILLIIISAIFAGCKGNNKVNNDFLEEKAPSKEGIEFIVKGKSSQYAEYIDHDFHLKATLPAGDPFIYEFSFRSVIKYPPDNNDSEQDNNVDKEKVKSVLMDRTLHIRYKYKDDDLDRNYIIIMSTVGDKPHFIILELKLMNMNKHV